MKPQYQQEFPDYPDLDVTLPDGYVDASWHNDTCPSFYRQLAGGLFAQVLIDHPDKDKREFPGKGRFTYWVSHTDVIDADGVPGPGADDWAAFVQWDRSQGVGAPTLGFDPTARFTPAPEVQAGRRRRPTQPTLDDGQIDDIWDNLPEGTSYLVNTTDQRRFARAVEAAIMATSRNPNPSTNRPPHLLYKVETSWGTIAASSYNTLIRSDREIAESISAPVTYELTLSGLTEDQARDVRLVLEGKLKSTEEMPLNRIDAVCRLRAEVETLRVELSRLIAGPDTHKDGYQGTLECAASSLELTAETLAYVTR